MKKHWKTILLTSLLTLLPMAVGLMVWGRLPERVPTHWGPDGTVDGWSGRAFAVFGIPAILLGVHLLCAFVTSLDPKGAGLAEKMLGLVLWITPCVGIFVAATVYPTALGYAVDVNFLAPLLIGGLFVFIGNYLPKLRPNYTVGIKLPWTLASEENWTKTHRLAGPLWVAGGLVTIAAAFLSAPVPLIVAILLVVALVPMLYSAALYYRGR
ncbi:MAG: SdpI family protein [bacterium]